MPASARHSPQGKLSDMPLLKRAGIDPDAPATLNDAHSAEAVALPYTAKHAKVLESAWESISDFIQEEISFSALAPSSLPGGSSGN